MCRFFPFACPFLIFPFSSSVLLFLFASSLLLLSFMLRCLSFSSSFPYPSFPLLAFSPFTLFLRSSLLPFLWSPLLLMIASSSLVTIRLTFNVYILFSNSFDNQVRAIRRPLPSVERVGANHRHPTADRRPPIADSRPLAACLPACLSARLPACQSFL